MYCLSFPANNYGGVAGVRRMKLPHERAMEQQILVYDAVLTQAGWVPICTNEVFSTDLYNQYVSDVLISSLCLSLSIYIYIYMYIHVYLYI